jgi:hypothetical protein
MELSPKQITYHIIMQTSTSPKKNEIIPCILTDHNEIKLKNNSKENQETIQTSGD